MGAVSASLWARPQAVIAGPSACLQPATHEGRSIVMKQQQGFQAGVDIVGRPISSMSHAICIRTQVLDCMHLAHKQCKPGQLSHLLEWERLEGQPPALQPGCCHHPRCCPAAALWRWSCCHPASCCCWCCSTLQGRQGVCSAQDRGSWPCSNLLQSKAGIAGRLLLLVDSHLQSTQQGVFWRAGQSKAGPGSRSL